MGLPFRAEPLDFWLGASKKMEKKFPAWVTQEKKTSLPGSIRKKIPVPVHQKKKNPCPWVRLLFQKDGKRKKKSLPIGWRKKKFPAHVYQEKKFPALECQVKKIPAWLQFSTPPTKNLMVRPLFCFRLKWAHWARWSLGTIWPRLFGQLFS